jgi:ppGpp synthetase/RelA/SpoT-type nucleotidyltranferase
LNLEIFEHIGEVLDAYEDKKEVYKLIAEEIKDFFETHVFRETTYELNFTYRIKTETSIREKIIRNNYNVNKGGGRDILASFQDVIGCRIECKFLEEEEEAFRLLGEVFTKTDDNIFYYMPSLPKIQLKLADPQPQMQHNGFEIYKIDGQYLLGREVMRFELQIKALVNMFWGEIEHRMVYKNNDYLIADSFVADLFTSIKKNLDTIDNQLYILYNRFRNQRDAGRSEMEKAEARRIEIFVANMVYETFTQLLEAQMGFSIDFKGSCDAVVRYLMDVNEADDLEDYGEMMLYIFNLLNDAHETVRLDEQVEFERKLYHEDVFCGILIETVQKLINVNYRWHLYYVILFYLSGTSNAEALEACISFFRDALYANRSFTLLEEAGIEESPVIRMELLNTVAKVVAEKKDIVYFCAEGMTEVHRALNYVVPMIISSYAQGRVWEEMKETAFDTLKERMELSKINGKD